jgi:hypothetical protein
MTPSLSLRVLTPASFSSLWASQTLSGRAWKILVERTEQNVKNCKLFSGELGRRVVDPKKKSRCPQPKLLAAQSLFLQTAEAFRKMATCLRQEQAANLYSDKPSAVDASRSAHDLFQLISLPLRAAKSVFTNLMFSLAGSHGANR